jgi:uncharacterized protein (DUF2141 family)
MKKSVLFIVASTIVLFGNELSLEIKHLTTTCGTLKIGLFDSKNSFPSIDKVFKGVTLHNVSSNTKYIFDDVSNGVYAIAIFCDENKNGQLDTNFLGVPKEVYGFSNNPKVFGKPSFTDSCFELTGSKKIVIEAK